MPDPLRSIPSRRMPLVIVDVADRGWRRRHEGVRGVVVHVVEEEEVRAVVLICQVRIQPGVDNGGKRSGVTSVGLRGRQCQAGEGGGGGAAPRGQRRRQRRRLHGRGGGRGRGEGEGEMEGEVEGEVDMEGEGGKKGKRFV